MSERYVSLAEARKKLGELLARVHYGGERVVVTKHGKPMAAIVPIDDLAIPAHAAPTNPATEPVEPRTESVSIPATRSQVWWAIMDPRQRAQWWPLAEIDREVGCEFTQWSADEEAAGLTGRVSEYEDGERIQVQWADGSRTTVGLGDGDGDGDGDIRVTVTHTAGQPPPGWLLDLDALRAFLA